MLTEEVPEFIPADVVVDLADTENEVDDNVESDAEAGKVSELQRLVAVYLDTHNRSKAFIDRMAVVMFNDDRFRRICRTRAMKYGADLKDVDEVQQRVMIVFFGPQLNKLREADAVYAVIYAIANNVSREVVRDSLALTINHDSIEEMHERGHELEQVSLVDSEQEDRDLILDSQAAAAQLAQAFKKHLNGEEKLSTHGVFDLDPLVAAIPGVSTSEADDVAVMEPEPQRLASRVRRGAKTRSQDLSPEQRELVDICAELGLRNQDFAAALGIGLPRLSSYIYGRTASVPDDVMKLARQMRDEDPEAVARRKRFDRPMSAILKGWAKELSIAEDDDQELAVVFGVTPMTSWRWRHDETKPDQTSLSRYEQQVRQYKARHREIESRSK
ncbi:hypothetical protein [Ralstonia pseudosolanacearum]|uniref:hypothetical protein n=1 Tax=Ralstonia pseudosolanacearum TaxID=1310165 RepID=UPI003CF4E6B8